MKHIIIGIHGLSNKPSKKTLRRWWLRSIREGLKSIGQARVKIPFELVYWADIIYTAPQTQKVRDKSHPLFLKEPYAKSILQPQPEHSPIRIKMMKYFEAQLDKILLNEDMTVNFKGITDHIIHRFAQDLELYYGEYATSPLNPTHTIKEAIQNRLIQTIKSYRGYKILLIAHSMGSIVAFDVLWTLNNGQPIHRFITLGSPLGLPVITARVFADQKAVQDTIGKPHAPECVAEQWLNMSDIRDKVALDHTLADDYAPNTKGISAQDFIVHNDYSFKGRPNEHKSYGYLRTPEIATAIDDFLSETLKNRVLRLIKRVLRAKLTY